MRRAVVTLGAAMVILGGAVHARAETILLTGGFLEWAATSEGPVLALQGTGGFSMGPGFVSISGGFFSPWNHCYTVPECTPGVTVDLGAGWSGSDLTTMVTYQGNTFEVGGGNLPSLLVDFDGSFIVPETGGLVTAPFVVTGILGYPTGGPEFGRAGIMGSGIASIWLSPWNDPSFPNALRLDRIRYDVGAAAPVPEPASMLLLGAGLGGAVAARRRRRLRT